MSNYIYKSPLEYGYKQFKLTKNQYNKIFPKHKLKWCDKYEFYYNEHSIIIHKFINWLGIMTAILLFPIEIIICGLKDFKEIIIDYKKMFNQKKYGAFVENYVNKNNDKYNQIKELIK